MNQITDPVNSFRILNLSDVDLSLAHVLKIDTDTVGPMVETIRRYADLPYVYVVSEQRANQIPALLSALGKIRSPCYPYAIFALNEARIEVADADVALFGLDGAGPNEIETAIMDFARKRLAFNKAKLAVGSTDLPPANVDVTIVGAGVTGLYAAARLRRAGISCCVLEARSETGGIWSQFANRVSQVNSSESAYRLFDKKARSNRDHSFAREILEDIAQLSAQVKDLLYLNTRVDSVEKIDGGYQTTWSRPGEKSSVVSKGLILAINDRVGRPNETAWENQSQFQGEIVAGISDQASGVNWRDKNVVVVGMGAFAIENVRTALEAGARHVTVVCRRHGTVCPKIIDYLNFATPYDENYLHDNKSNLRNMMYWKKMYTLSGATQPECWMGKIKHPGHTISVSDIWFIGHYLKKIDTVAGEITRMTANGVEVGEQHIEADVVVNCIGFERNAAQMSKLSGYQEMYNNNYVDKDFMYLADAYIDDNAFNSFFGSSVLEMVKFYMEVFVTFFDNAEYEEMVAKDGIEKITATDRKWSHYIQAAMALIRGYPDLADTAAKQVDDRTQRFLEIHDLETYIAENKREWLDTHRLLSGRPMSEQECLPYVFDKLLPN